MIVNILGVIARDDVRPGQIFGFYLLKFSETDSEFSSLTYINFKASYSHVNFEKKQKKKNKLQKNNIAEDKRIWHSDLR